MVKNRGPILRAERTYVVGMRSLFRGIHDVYDDYLQRVIKDVSNTHDAFGAPGKKPSGKAKQDIDALQKAINKQIAPKVRPLFNVMSGTVAKANKATLKQLIPITLKDAGVDKILSNIQDANVKLVEAAGRDYASQVRDIFTDPNNYGTRVEVLAKQLQDRSNVSDSRAELIARDQTLKTNASINQARQEDSGIEEYTWSTSLDERVRGNPDGKWPDADPSHYDLEGKVFSWDDPPEPGHPGEDYQCRCIAVPYIPLLADIEFDY